MMMVTPQVTSDPLLVRVWWVDVGRVAGDCSYDDTRWGCKNDPTMGKKDNPNPRLRKADIRTGQRGADEVVRTIDEILAGLYTGDMDIAMERCAAFAHVVALGIRTDYARSAGQDGAVPGSHEVKRVSVYFFGGGRRGSRVSHSIVS